MFFGMTQFGREPKAQDADDASKQLLVLCAGCLISCEHAYIVRVHAPVQVLRQFTLKVRNSYLISNFKGHFFTKETNLEPVWVCDISNERDQIGTQISRRDPLSSTLGPNKVHLKHVKSDILKEYI